MLDWLERNVHMVLDRVDKCDAFVVECEEKRKRNYRKAPRNVLRHIVLSDIKEAMEILAEVSFVQRSLKKKKKRSVTVLCCQDMLLHSLLHWPFFYAQSKPGINLIMEYCCVVLYAC